MTVATKKVQGRRKVRYESYADLLADAERMAGIDVRPLGNWSPGQAYEHLARSYDASIDGMDMSIPAPMRWIMTLLFKKKFLKQGIPAGFKSPDKYVAGETSAEEGLASLRAAVARQESETSRVPHPAFGEIGCEGWNDFNLRHAEMHMSFLVEGEAG